MIYTFNEDGRNIDLHVDLVACIGNDWVSTKGGRRFKVSQTDIVNIKKLIEGEQPDGIFDNSFDYTFN